MGSWTPNTFLTPQMTNCPLSGATTKPTWPSKMEIGQRCRNWAGQHRAKDGKTHPWLSSPHPPTPPSRSHGRFNNNKNQRKNNLLVLMGLVLSLPRTFQPGSRDRSGGGGG